MQPKDFKSYDEALAFVDRVASEGMDTDKANARDVLLSLEATRVIATCEVLTDPRVPKERAKDVIMEIITIFALQAAMVHIHKLTDLADEMQVCSDQVVPAYLNNLIKECAVGDKRYNLLFKAVVQEFMPDKIPPQGMPS